MKQSEAKAAFLQQHLKPGEIYAGILLGQNGEPDQHIILLPGDQAGSTWKAQMDWAASVGGSLPTRREQSLLFANLKDQFQSAWYWSGETYAGDAAYTWCQYFYDGYQSSGHKDGNYRARAVRRLPI